MPTIKTAVGPRVSLTATGLTTLAASTYLVTSVFTCDTNKPTDVIVELLVGTTNTPAGNKQVIVFGQESLDGTVFRSGPTSGTTTTDEPDLRYVGVLPLNTSSTVSNHIGFFSIANAFGYVPYAVRLVIKNDVGVALTTATLVTSEITTTVY